MATSTWIMSDGRSAEVEIMEITECRINADGDVMMAPCYEQWLIARVGGVEHARQREITPQGGRSDGIVASIGRLGISADNLARILEARRTPRYLEDQTRRAACREAGREYAARTAAIERMMHSAEDR